MQIKVNFKVAGNSITEVIEVPSNASVTHSQSSPTSNQFQETNKLQPTPRSTLPGNSAGLDNTKQSTMTKSQPLSSKSNRTSPAETNLDRSKRLDSRQPWNSSTRINKDACISCDDKAKPARPESNCCDTQNEFGMAELKTNSQPQKNSRANDSAAQVERNAQSTVRSQPIINSPSRRPQSEFSTRWPPSPIRSSYPGRTTAGRWLYNGRDIYDTNGSEKPFYERSPAGIPTISSGSVDECMRWHYGTNRSGQRTSQQRNYQDGQDLDLSVNIGIDVDDHSIRAGSKKA